MELLRIEDYIVQRIKEISPEVDITQGSGVRDLLVSPLVPILTPLAQEIFRIRQVQSLDNADKLSMADVDGLLANIFVTRKEGEKSRGVVRVILRDAENTTIDAGTIFYATEGLQFASTAKVTVTVAQILAGGEDYYYIDVNVIAAEEGKSYDIDPYEIAGVITTNSNIVGARNEAAFYGGKDTETNADIITRAKTAITQRDLNVRNGILYIVPENFEQVDRVDVVGFGDAAMERDIITGRNLVFSGIQIPDSDSGAHCGAMADIYVKVGTVEYNVNIQNPQDEEDPKNTVALYTEAEDPTGSAQVDTLYELPACYNIEKPVVALEDVFRINAVGTQLQELEEGKDFIVYVNSAAHSMSMEDRRAIKFCRGAGMVNTIVDTALTPISPIKEVPALCRMDNYYSINAIKNEGFADHLKVTMGEDILDFTTSYAGQASLKFKGDNSAYAFFDDTSDVALGTVMQGASGFTVATWIRPSLVFNGSSDVYDTYVSDGNIYKIYQQTIFCMGNQDVNSPIADDEHIFAMHLYYDEGLDEGRLKVVIGTEHVSIPTSTLSEVFFTKGNAYKFVFLAVTYKASDFSAYGTLKAYTQFEDGSYGSGNGLPQQILYQASPFVASGSLRLAWKDRFCYVGRANPDAITQPVDPNIQTLSYPFHGHIDDLMIDTVAYKEAQIADLFSQLSSVTVTLSNQCIYNSDGNGALNLAFGNEPPGEKPFNGLRMQGTTGLIKGGIYEVIDSEYIFADDTIQLTLRTATGYPNLNKVMLGDRLIVTPIFTGQDGQLTSTKPGLVYSDRIEYEDGTTYTFAEDLSEGDWAPIGTSLRFTYRTSADIEQIQDFVDSKLQRTVVSGNLVKYMNPVLVDLSTVITTTAADTTTLASKISGISNFINSIEKGGSLEVSDVINKLYDLGCAYVQMPLYFTISVRDSEGRLYSETVADKYTLDGSQVFIADDIIITETV
jgi:hypothetical protein